MDIQKLLIHLVLEILLWIAGLDDVGDVIEYCQHHPLKSSIRLEQVLY